MVKRITFILTLTFLLIARPVSVSAAPSGWDYNLTKKCAKSLLPNQSNYYSETAQCTGAASQWSVINQSQTVDGSTCAPSNSQSLPLNGTSPLALSWTNHTDENGSPNWLVTLTSDFISRSYPCDGGHLVKYLFQDNSSQLSRPSDLSTSVSLKSTGDNPTGGYRSFIGLVSTWDGKKHQIEINLDMSDNWPTEYPDDELLMSTTPPSGVDEYVAVDGHALGISLIAGQTSTVNVKWADIISQLISLNQLTAPVSGFGSAATNAVFVGTEADTYVQTNSVKTVLEVTNFRNSTTSISSSSADANLDGATDLMDFSIWKQEYLKTLSTQKADFDKNSLIDLADFALWKKSYLGL